MARGRGRWVILLGVVVLAAGAWFLRGLIPGPWSRAPEPVEVSEAAAASADAKLERLREDGDTIRLSGVEFTSYLRYRMVGRFAVGIESPSVTFDGAGARVTGSIPKDGLPLDRLGKGADFLPDPVDVAVGGTVRTLAPGRAALRIESLSAARIPVPHDTYEEWLSHTGGRDEAGLQPDEVAFQLPPGVGSARIEDGALVLAR